MISWREVLDLNEVLRKLSRPQLAKTVAYGIAPSVIILLLIGGIIRGFLAVESQQPIAISELKTEISETGIREAKTGIVVIAEPSDEVFVIDMGPASRIWSSLDDKRMLWNTGRLGIKNGTLTGQTPFIGVSEPVTIVVDGTLGKEMALSGRTESPEHFRLYSRRGSDLVLGGLAVCFLTLGIAIAHAAPVN